MYKDLAKAISEIQVQGKLYCVFFQKFYLSNIRLKLTSSLKCKKSSIKTTYRLKASVTMGQDRQVTQHVALGFMGNNGREVPGGLRKLKSIWHQLWSLHLFPHLHPL